MASIPGRDFATVTRDLLFTLGYRSERRPLRETDSPADFIGEYPAREPGTASEVAFRKSVDSVRVLFQITDAEITTAVQHTLFDTAEFSRGNTRSFLFVTVELKEDHYPRGQYAQFTREINKRFPAIPAMVLYRTTSGRLTVAFVHRREHKRDPSRDVQGRVFLIREIDTGKPHRAHLDILEDLSLTERLQWINVQGWQPNFDSLLAAWLDALDTEELNRRFYQELFDWFQRAVKEAKFPSTVPVEEQVIRLITRILFVWFIKEKGLVREEWFVRGEMEELLNHFDGSDYYRAALQNLFFATLNTEMGRRGFSTRTEPSHRVFSRFRYRSLIRETERFEELMKQTPFINGGLFDCLDNEESRSAGGKRIDMFSDPDPRGGPRAAQARREAWRELNVPDGLFFEEDTGLFALLNRYKFTVEENTPIEQDVALDPELLGKVFENLLAAYNPETRETARRQTGSYYTPRPVVDYMVEEALVAALAEKVHPHDGDADYWEARLRYLLDYEDSFNDANDLFVEAEAEDIVRTIAEIKVLDPAVGSGAFPMASLHKLTLALRRLDPDNLLWESVQKEIAGRSAQEAFEVKDQVQREAELKEISATFEKYRDSDFGRKLYLIQNSIYGVDIQTIACQIAKLRFFITLAIEQRTDETAENHGIKPLPNLETRFVAADTLLGLEKPEQFSLGQTTAVLRLEREIEINRERHFHAKIREEKRNCIEVDARLRASLAKNLEKSGLSAKVSKQIASWDPYDQNASSKWFDATYMFGVRSGFDVVIGNPPYIQLQKERGRLGKLYKDAGYDTFARTGDVYQLFYECGCRHLRPGGLLAYITSNSWLKAEYGRSLRRYLRDEHTPLTLVEMGKDVFENTIVDTSILLVRAAKRSDTRNVVDAVDMDRVEGRDFPPDRRLWGQAIPDGDRPWRIFTRVEQSVMEKMEAKGVPLRDWDVAINYGIKTGYNDAFIVDRETRDSLITQCPDAEKMIKPLVRGRDVQRYRVKWGGLWLINVPWHFPLHGDSSITGSSSRAEKVFKEQFAAVYEHLQSHKRALSRRSKAETGIRYEWYVLQRWGAKYWEDFGKRKLIWMDLTDRGRVAYDPDGMFCLNTTFIMTGGSIEYLCALLNSKLISWFMDKTASKSGMGVNRWINATVEKIPVPRVSTRDQRDFIRVLDRILKAKGARSDGEQSGQDEAEIDHLVYELYGLTPEEVEVIERGRER